MLRLDKYLSQAGAASRRELKSIIRSGRVTVGGQTVCEPDTKIPEDAVVMLDGVLIGAKGRIVLMLHKPAGYVTSTADPRDPTVMELLPEKYQKLFPVGRLDKETEGLLLFTDDGDLCHHLTSPKHDIKKRYYAETRGTLDETDVEAFRAGITLRDGTVLKPAELEILEKGCYVTVREGKYHQVRRMLASRGKPVIYLRREMENCLTLGELKPGEYRELTESEVARLL